jgi:hypothetical protein
LSKVDAGEDSGMVSLGGLGLGPIGLGGQRSRTGYSYAWPWLYEEEAEMARDDDDDESVSNIMLKEILWMWTADPLHFLCTIPECEEDQGSVRRTKEW